MEPMVTVRAKATIYRGQGMPFPPGSEVSLPQSHAAALKAAGLVEELDSPDQDPE